MRKCTHKYVHKETSRVVERNGRSDSRCQNWVQTDIFFCEKCLEEKVVKKEWCGVEHEYTRPDWTKGEFERVTIW